MLKILEYKLTKYKEDLYTVKLLKESHEKLMTA